MEFAVMRTYQLEVPEEAKLYPCFFLKKPGCSADLPDLVAVCKDGLYSIASGKTYSVKEHISVGFGIHALYDSGSELLLQLVCPRRREAVEAVVKVSSVHELKHARFNYKGFVLETSSGEIVYGDTKIHEIDRSAIREVRYFELLPFSITSRYPKSKVVLPLPYRHYAVVVKGKCLVLNKDGEAVLTTRCSRNRGYGGIALLGEGKLTLPVGEDKYIDVSCKGECSATPVTLSEYNPYEALVRDSDVGYLLVDYYEDEHNMSRIEHYLLLPNGELKEIDYYYGFVYSNRIDEYVNYTYASSDCTRFVSAFRPRADVYAYNLEGYTYSVGWCRTFKYEFLSQYGTVDLIRRNEYAWKKATWYTYDPLVLCGNASKGVTFYWVNMKGKPREVEPLTAYIGVDKHGTIRWGAYSMLYSTGHLGIVKDTMFVVWECGSKAPRVWTAELKGDEYALLVSSGAAVVGKKTSSGGYTPLVAVGSARELVKQLEMLGAVVRVRKSVHSYWGDYYWHVFRNEASIISE